MRIMTLRKDKSIYLYESVHYHTGDGYFIPRNPDIRGTASNRQWLKPIKFELPFIQKDMYLSLDNDTQVETIGLFENGDL